jgi:erythronate-4-phosphate dehydrogenase
MKIIADDKIPFLKGVLDIFADVKYLPGSKISNADLKDADALIIRTRTKCNAQLLDNTNVRFIATATIGFDHIDTAYCEKHNIFWTNAPGCNSGSVKQYMASVLVNMAEKRQFSLTGKTIGIIGVGNVGKKIANLCKTLKMNVLLNDPPRERKEKTDGFVTLEQIQKEADIITFHVPLNNDGEDQTYHLANSKFFKNLTKPAILINCSRGEVVDGKALKKALKKGEIEGAVLDVWEEEPNIDPELVQLLDFATPHIAGYSADGKANGTAMSIHALCKIYDIPLASWFPDDVPQPLQPFINLDNSSKNCDQLICKLINETYKVQEDDQRLRHSLDTFEKQRGDYPIRREFQAYTVHLAVQDEKLKKMIVNLGFRME